MRYKDILKQKTPFFVMLSSLFILSSCGSSQQYAQQDNDGIYDSTTSNVVVYQDNDTADNIYYKNYFKEKSQEIEIYNSEQDSVFTDIDSYQSNNYAESDINQNDYNGNGGWGEQTEGVSVTIYNDPYMYGGFGYPYYGYGWGYAGWYRPYYGGWGYGWGWGGGYYPPYYGGGGWGYPGYPGWNQRPYNNGYQGNNMGYRRGVAYNSNNRYLNSTRYNTTKTSDVSSSSRYQNLTRNSKTSTRTTTTNNSTNKRLVPTTRTTRNYSTSRTNSTNTTSRTQSVNNTSRNSSSNRSYNTSTPSTSNRSYSSPSSSSGSSSRSSSSVRSSRSR